MSRIGLVIEALICKRKDRDLSRHIYHVLFTFYNEHPFMQG